MAAALLSSTSRASASRRSRNLRSSSSRFSASRDRRSARRLEPRLFSVSLGATTCVGGVMVVESTVDGGGDDFCFVGVGLSPNPLPADRAHDCDNGCWTIGEKCVVVNALANKGPVL